MRCVPYLGVALALFVSGTVTVADGDLAVVKDGGKLLYENLEAAAKKHFEARRQAVAALKTPEDVEKRRLGLKAKFSAQRLENCRTNRARTG